MDRLQDLVLLWAATLSGMFGLLFQQASYAAAPLTPPQPHTTVLFVGDMMFDRTIRQAMESYGSDYVFTCMDTVLSQSDMVAGNLEGPITDNPSKSVGSAVGTPDNFIFTFPTYVAPLLKRHNLRVVSLGNNHIYNFGNAGIRATISALNDAGIGYFGEPGGHSVSDIESGGIPLTFIGYNEFDAGWSASTTIAEIEDAAARGRVPVVFSHWGVEYERHSNSTQRALAHAFIDAGAAIVIGAHPHVIEERETYHGKYIYYSLGNFIFDQYWNADVRTGLLVQATISRDGVIVVQESEVALTDNRKTCPIDR